MNWTRERDQHGNLELMVVLQLPAIPSLLTECEGAVCTRPVFARMLFSHKCGFPLICRPPQWKKKRATTLLEGEGCSLDKHKPVALCFCCFCLFFILAGNVCLLKWLKSHQVISPWSKSIIWELSPPVTFNSFKAFSSYPSHPVFPVFHLPSIWIE